MRCKLPKAAKKPKAQIFQLEDDMQVWLDAKLASHSGIKHLIMNEDILEGTIGSTPGERKIIDSFRRCVEKLDSLKVLSSNENISLSATDVLKPDVLCYSMEYQSFVVIELKALNGPTRQAGTEIGAYAREIKSYVPFLSDGDVFNVIISQHWPTLLKQHIFQEIYWGEKNILCLEPIRNGKKIRLQIFDPAKLADDELLHKLSPRHLMGYQICLYDNRLYSFSVSPNDMDKRINVLRYALQVMASTGSKINSNGFAILWKDLNPSTLSPYNITLVNIAPMNSLERFFHSESSLPGKIGSELFDIMKESACSSGYGPALEAIYKSAEPILETFSSPTKEGHSDWVDQKYFMRGPSQLMEFHAWGAIQSLYSDFIHRKIIKEKNIKINPLSAKYGMEFLEEIIDDSYVFLDRWNDPEPDEDGCVSV